MHCIPPLCLSYETTSRPRSNPYAQERSLDRIIGGLFMLDLLYIAIGLAGFAVCIGYVRLCEFL